MMRWLFRLALVALIAAGVTVHTPAPLVYRPGEGWTYESIGGAKWRRTRAKDQLEVAQEAFDRKDFKLAYRAARYVVRTWPLSDYAPKAQYLVGRCLEEKHSDEKAFRAYQTLMTKYPKIDSYEDVLERQYTIANRFLAGQWFKLWGVIPFFSSMDKTVKMYEELIKNGPYSKVAPPSQMNIGAAREKQSDFVGAVKAYEKAADKYHDMGTVAPDAIYKAGEAYHKQATTADYDQSVAGKAIATFSDFTTLYPAEPRVAGAQKTILALRTEQARGNYQTARYYEKKRKWEAALIYYNEVLLKDANSTFAEEAKQRIETLKQRVAQQAQNQPAAR